MNDKSNAANVNITVSVRGTRKRSILKAATYRIVIVCLDFLTIYLFTGKTTIAFGFTLVSNSYSTVVYFLHERVWAHVRWER